jgi:nucleoside-diphosphate-sugar epimerase
MKHALITGVSGFVGRALSKKMIDEGWQVRGTILASEIPPTIIKGIEPITIEPIGPKTNWKDVLAGIDIVIHLAARVHILHETASDPLEEFRITNTEGTAQLAKQASDAGVKRFVFMSTIGVNGDCSENMPFTESCIPVPHNPYSISKLEAEKRLADISLKTGMEIVVIRAPLVYGPGNPGNFLSLMQIISRGLPLPFKSVTNLRSLIYVGNLVDALTTCAVHPAAAGKTYLVSDGEDVSTPELIRRVANAMRKPARLFPVPLAVMHTMGAMAGKSRAVRRLLGSLTVNSSKIRTELGWAPPFSMEEGLKVTAEWYLQL